MLEALLWSFFISPLKIVWESLRILESNKLVFTSILCFTTLPLSFLTFTLAISTFPLQSRVLHLESVARVAGTRVEARHVWHESRDDAVSLLRTRALFALLCFPLSLAAAVSAVHATASAAQGKPAALRGSNWKRPAVTVVFVYVVLMAFAPVPRALAAAAFTSPPWIRILVRAIGSGLEVYLMTVLSLSLVVSVIEDRVGWEAIRVGSGLIRGRRACGWILSGSFVLVSGLMNRKVEVLLLENENSEIGVFDKSVLVCSYALVVLVSYVVTTVFYCDSRRRHHDNGGGIKEPQPQDDHEIEDSVVVDSSQL
ncbi:hypothetical protein JHK85_039779 [Glycine max]|uniref:Transmembrane protein n=1 Tax=Glycine soja TaxID=3848 RepID=A0A445H2I4_GLYSO|nr:uncharacterized protein LOC114385270 [Glycine soja]KAG4964804.1 hypothetical protein JHK85_039779 [Glycine max]RZB67828.1 hypothetical protein D0Y65_037924 [Glycine soja]